MHRALIQQLRKTPKKSSNLKKWTKETGKKTAEGSNNNNSLDLYREVSINIKKISRVGQNTALQETVMQPTITMGSKALYNLTTATLWDISKLVDRDRTGLWWCGQLQLQGRRPAI